MGAFNIVRLLWKDEISGTDVPITIQFKYGERWQHEYVMGDELIWGTSRYSTPNPGYKEVMVDGYLEEENLPGVPVEFDVYIVGNRIARVEPMADIQRYIDTKEEFIIIKK